MLSHRLVLPRVIGFWECSIHFALCRILRIPPSQCQGPRKHPSESDERGSTRVIATTTRVLQPAKEDPRQYRRQNLRRRRCTAEFPAYPQPKHARMLASSVPAIEGAV
ncbi:hypothetical protein EXIGLDRAFT_727889, partial [Exidia glandulosa HHB12029]